MSFCIRGVCASQRVISITRSYQLVPSPEGTLFRLAWYFNARYFFKGTFFSFAPVLFHMNILTVSGSLRRVSSNTTLLHAAALLAPDGVTVMLFTGLGDLPYFNPDLEGDPPLSVRDWQERLASADAMLISSPEYAHGVPGVLKNALDWVVGSGELIGKPVGLLNASPRSAYAYESLKETLTVMTAQLVPGACVTLPVAGQGMNAEALAAHPEIGPILQGVLAALNVC